MEKGERSIQEATMGHDDETGKDPSVRNEPELPTEGHDERLPDDPEHPIARPGVTVEAEEDQEARRRQHDHDRREAGEKRKVEEAGYPTETDGSHRPAGMGDSDGE